MIFRKLNFHLVQFQHLKKTKKPEKNPTKNEEILAQNDGFLKKKKIKKVSSNIKKMLIWVFIK